MNTDIKLLLYHCLQYSYNKRIRTKHRINGPQLNILTAIYYGLVINPQRWGRSIKQCIRTLNPQLDANYVIRDIVVLDNKGLITYSEISSKNYTIELTSEGKQLIEQLFDKKAIDSYIRDNRDRV